MKCFLYIIPLLLLFSCSTQNTRMTRGGYGDVAVGMSAKQLETLYGKPYNVYSKGGASETYEYIERITMGTEAIEQRRYFIVIENGKVVGKYMKLSNPPPYEAIYSDDPYPNY